MRATCQRLPLLVVCAALQLGAQQAFSEAAPVAENHGGWPVWGGDSGGTRFSPLRDIDKDNVAQLQLAWEYHTGDSSALRPDMPPSSFLATPVLHDNTLYFCSGYSRAFAVDAETGEQRWVYDSKPAQGGNWTSK